MAAERDGTIAFEAAPIAATTARTFRLYAGLPGARPRLLDEYTVPPACVSDGLWLRGSTVLLTATHIARLSGIHRSHPPVDLEPAIDWLRARHRTGQPSLL
jgi:hypothetical protein